MHPKLRRASTCATCVFLLGFVFHHCHSMERWLKWLVSKWKESCLPCSNEWESDVSHKTYGFQIPMQNTTIPFIRSFPIPIAKYRFQFSRQPRQRSLSPSNRQNQTSFRQAHYGVDEKEFPASGTIGTVIITIIYCMGLGSIEEDRLETQYTNTQQ